MMTDDRKIEISLFLLRLTVFIVMAAWTIDKFVDPSHGAAIFQHFYGVDDTPAMAVQALGAAEMAIILAFLAGIAKRWTYGFVMVVHGLTTLASWKQYTIDINLLFYAAWPMLAACITLYLLRDRDVLLTLGSRSQALPEAAE